MPILEAVPWLLHLPGRRLISLPLRMNQSSSVGPPVVESSRLIPVIEIVPSIYQKEGRHPPPPLAKDDLGAWSAYWRDSLADSGITGLMPIREGSWLVATSSFEAANQATLDQVLSKQWNQHEVLPLDAEDADPALLSGGFCLIDENAKLWLEPTCCGDLGTLADWVTVAASPPTAWSMLWIGHPWVHVRGDGANLLFGNCTDNELPDEEVFAVPLSRLQTELDSTHAELVRFSRLIQRSLEVFGCTGDLESAARRICGVGTDPAHA